MFARIQRDGHDFRFDRVRDRPVGFLLFWAVQASRSLPDFLLFSFVRVCVFSGKAGNSLEGGSFPFRFVPASLPGRFVQPSKLYLAA